MCTKVKNEEGKEDIRSNLVNYIRIHPGASFKNIRTIFNIPESTLRYYLRDLERKERIRSNKNKRIYFPVDRKFQSDLSKIQQKLIYYIKSNSGITQKELASLTKMNRVTIRNNINSLIDSEIISITKIGKEIQHNYIYPEELEKQKIIRLISKFLMEKIDEETYWELRRVFSEDSDTS